jgi:hypothetical protein
VNTNAAAQPRRLLLALHDVEPAPDLLWAANALLQGPHAELAGLFVEDAQLLRLAALPFTREIGLASGTARAFDVPDLERALRGQAEKLRHWLAQMAAQLQVPWSFRVARGSLLEEALAGAAQADLVLIGQRTRMVERSLARREAPPAEAAVAALFDATEAAFRALDAALLLAQGRVESIRLLLPATSAAERERLRRLAAERLRVAPSLARVEAQPRAGEPGPAAQRRRALVLAAGSIEATRRELERLMETAQCPLILVR